jgi:membrane protease YdiL (CAAX protease family)
VTTSSYFFQGINFKKLLSIALVMGFAAAAINAMADINMNRSRSYDWLEFVKNLSLYASCSLMGLIFAEKTSLEVFLLKRRGSRRIKGLMLLLFGVIPGVIVGLIYHHLFFQYRFSLRVPLRVRAIHTHYDSFILSLRAGVTEELVFRFLLLTAFFYILRRVFLPLAGQGFKTARWIPFLFSLLGSSLLFGLVHGAYGFMIAFLAGLVLGMVYFRAGLETAILAHFAADLVFFNLTYL